MHLDNDYEIEIRVSLPFEGSHALPVRPELHLHHWEAEFSVSGPLNPETGMVCDMLELNEFFKPYIEEMDRTNLHEFEGFRSQTGVADLAAKYPTCDTLAHYLFRRTSSDFNQCPRFTGLRISQIKVSIFEPGHKEAWGHAIIRPK